MNLTDRLIWFKKVFSVLKVSVKTKMTVLLLLAGGINTNTIPRNDE